MQWAAKGGGGASALLADEDRTVRIYPNEAPAEVVDPLHQHSVVWVRRRVERGWSTGFGGGFDSIRTQRGPLFFFAQEYNLKNEA